MLGDGALDLNDAIQLGGGPDDLVVEPVAVDVASGRDLRGRRRLRSPPLHAPQRRAS